MQSQALAWITQATKVTRAFVTIRSGARRRPVAEYDTSEHYLLQQSGHEIKVQHKDMKKRRTTKDVSGSRLRERWNEERGMKGWEWWSVGEVSRWSSRQSARRLRDWLRDAGGEWGTRVRGSAGHRLLLPLHALQYRQHLLCLCCPQQLLQVRAECDGPAATATASRTRPGRRLLCSAGAVAPTLASSAARLATTRRTSDRDPDPWS